MNQREWKEVYGLQMGMCAIIRKGSSRKSSRKRNKHQNVLDVNVGYITVNNGPWPFEANNLSMEALWACETFREAKNKLLTQGK